MSNWGQAIVTVVFTVVGALIGSAYGAYYGFAIGMFVGGMLFPASTPEMSVNPGEAMGLQIQSSQYGITIPVIYGTRKVAGNLIWYGNYQTIKHEEEVETEGGKGGGGDPPTREWYTYSVSLAFGLCMGTKTVFKVWAGKDEISIGKLTIYDGTQTEPNAHLAGYVSRPPVWKNLCYVVLQNYDLGTNPGVPNFTFEVGDVQPFQWDSDAQHAPSPAHQHDDTVSDTLYLYTIELDTNSENLTMRKYEKSDLSHYATEVIDTNVTNGYIMGFMIYHSDGYIYLSVNKRVLDLRGFAKNVGTIFKIDPTIIGDGSPGDSVVIERMLCITGEVGAGEERSGDPYCACDATEPEAFYYLFADSLHIVGSTIFAGSLLYEWSGAAWGIYPQKCLIKIPLNLTSSIQYAILTADSFGATRRFKSDDSYLYGFYTDRLQRFSFSDLEAVSYITLSRIATKDLAIDSTYLYVLTGSTAAPRCSIIKVSLADWVEVDELINSDLIAGVAQDLNIDTLSGFLYVAGGENGIFRVELSTFTVYDNAEGGELIGSKRYNTTQLDSEYLYEIKFFTPGSVKTFLLKKYAIAVANDVAPPVITKDILTNNLYGLGRSIGIGYLDTDIFDATTAHCIENDLLISPVFNRQASVLDILQYIISHHDGYITYMDGKIAHNQLKLETSTGALRTNDNDIIQKEGQFPIEISKRGAREYINKVNVEYTKRNKDYVNGIAMADDMVDIDRHGLQDTTIRLNAFTSFERANKMANLSLRKSLSNPEGLTFKLGIKNLDIKPGQVWDISDSGVELYELPARILAIRESENYEIEIEALEEKDVYDYLVYGRDTSTPPSPPNLRTAPGSVVRPMAIELPALYVGEACTMAIAFTESSSSGWAGATLYGAYSLGGSYTQIASQGWDGITGSVSGVGIDNYTAFIDVDLDDDANLSSALDFDDLMTTPKKNLIAIKTAEGNKYIRFQDADLLAVRRWRLSGLIYDTVNTPLLNSYGSVASTNELAFYSHLPFALSIGDTDKARTLFYKVSSFNFYGDAQSLADVTAFSGYVTGWDDTPLSPFNVAVNSVGVDDDNEIIIVAGDIALSWMSRNRFNTGGYIYDRTDVIVDDPDFIEFEIEVRNGSGLLRSVSQSGKAYAYTAAMQSSDGGSTPYDIKIRNKTTLAVSDWITTRVNLI